MQRSAMQGYSCLMSAALQGHEDIVDLLLCDGAAINAHADDVGLFAPCDPPSEYPPEHPPEYPPECPPEYPPEYARVG